LPSISAEKILNYLKLFDGAVNIRPSVNSPKRKFAEVDQLVKRKFAEVTMLG